MSHLSLIHYPSSNEADNESVKFIRHRLSFIPGTMEQDEHAELRIDQWTGDRLIDARSTFS